MKSAGPGPGLWEEAREPFSLPTRAHSEPELSKAELKKKASLTTIMEWSSVLGATPKEGHPVRGSPRACTRPSGTQGVPPGAPGRAVAVAGTRPPRTAGALVRAGLRPSHRLSTTPFPQGGRGRCVICSFFNSHPKRGDRLSAVGCPGRPRDAERHHASHRVVLLRLHPPSGTGARDPHPGVVWQGTYYGGAALEESDIGEHMPGMSPSWVL